MTIVTKEAGPEVGAKVSPAAVGGRVDGSSDGAMAAAGLAVGAKVSPTAVGGRDGARGRSRAGGRREGRGWSRRRRAGWDRRGWTARPAAPDVATRVARFGHRDARGAATATWGHGYALARQRTQMRRVGSDRCCRERKSQLINSDKLDNQVGGGQGGRA